MDAIRMLAQTRRRMMRVVQDIEEDELLWIPPGFRNNILWNLGHVAVTQQLLLYAPAGLPLSVGEGELGQFRSGTSPADWSTPPALGDVLRLLNEQPARLEEDHGAGRFETYGGFQTRSGLAMATIEDALAFNQFHEGLHTGIMQMMRALWARQSASPDQRGQIASNSVRRSSP